MMFRPLSGRFEMARYPLNLPVQLKRDAEASAAKQGVSLNQFIVWAVAEKIGELEGKLDDPAFPRITYRRGASGQPTPVIRGTGIRVQTLVVAAEHWHMSAAEIAAEYGLSNAQVAEALAFFEAHRIEIESQIEVESRMSAGHGKA
jgi:uncharacterized protein (DUF433 family)